MKDFLNNTTNSFYIFTFIIFFLFGNVLFLLLLFTRIFYNKEYEKYKNYFLKDIKDNFYIARNIFNVEEKYPYYFYWTLNIIIVSSWSLYITTIILLWNIDVTQWIIPYLYLLSFVILILLHKKLFFFFWGFEDKYSFFR